MMAAILLRREHRTSPFSTKNKGDCIRNGRFGDARHVRGSVPARRRATPVPPPPAAPCRAHPADASVPPHPGEGMQTGPFCTWLGPLGLGPEECLTQALVAVEQERVGRAAAGVACQ